MARLNASEPGAAPTRRSVRHRTHALAALLVATVACAYWPVARHEFLNYDDDLFVTRNLHVQAGLSHESIVWAFTATDDANWLPLTWLSHMLDVELFGLAPAGHHLVNVLFHATNTLLLFLVLHRLSGARWRSASVAALFALHPLHVESVAWVAERKDVLSAFFWMLTMAAYQRYVERPGPARRVAVILLFGAGLMAKPMLVTLPFALLLLDFWPLNRLAATPAVPGPAADVLPARFARLVLEKAPLFCLAAAASVLTVVVQRHEGAVSAMSLAVLRGSAANAVVSYGKYFLKMLWPDRLAVFYPYEESLPLWQIALAVVFLCGTSLLAVLRRRRDPWLAVGWFWYLGTLVPVIGLVQIGDQALADRYTYLPLIGLFIAFTWQLAARGGPHLPGKALPVTGLAILLALGILTWRQLAFWRTSDTLFRHALAVTTGNWVAHNNLAESLINEGKIKEADAHLSAAVRLNPALVEEYAINYRNLGVVSNKQGHPRLALRYFSKAIEINPRYAEAYVNLALIAQWEGDRDTVLRIRQTLSVLAPERVPEVERILALPDKRHFRTAPPP